MTLTLPRVDGRRIAATVIGKANLRKPKKRQHRKTFGTISGPKGDAARVETVEEYLARGGKIKRVAMGGSGLNEEAGNG